MFHVKIKRSPYYPQTSEEVELKFRCGRMNKYYAELTNLCTITHTYYTKYTNLGVAEARACQIAGLVIPQTEKQICRGSTLSHRLKNVMFGRLFSITYWASQLCKMAGGNA
jgi:hypothetical protein